MTPGPRTGRNGSEAGPVAVVLRALGLGDLLTAVPALRGLRTALPEHRIVLATSAGLEPLASLIGGVDQVVAVGDLDRGIDASVLPASPDVAVNLHGRGPQSTRLLESLRPSRVVAFADRVAGVAGPTWREDEHEVLRWARLVAEAFGVEVDPDALDLDRPRAPTCGAAAGAVLVHPGAAYGSRRWPAERFAAVAARLGAQGMPVAVTGGPQEVELGRRVAREAGLSTGQMLAGRLSLVELAASATVAALVLSGDTGVAHLATAYRIPSVVLFGPAVPARWGPPPGRAQHRVLWRGSGEGERFADDPDPALLALGVDEVCSAVQATLSGARGGSLPGCAPGGLGPLRV